MYTTHGLMTAADLDEYRKDYDMNPEPITLGDLARELGAEPHEVWAFGNLDAPGPITNDLLIPADDADAIREAWGSAPTPDWTPGEYDPTGLLRARDAHN